MTSTRNASTEQELFDSAREIGMGWLVSHNHQCFGDLADEWCFEQLNEDELGADVYQLAIRIDNYIMAN